MITVTPSSNPSKTRVLIALFVCVSMTPLIGTEHGDQPEIFEDMLRKSYPKPQLNLDDPDYLRIDAYDVVHKMEYPSEEKIDEYDAFIYSGSGESAYANVEWIQKLIAFTVHLAKDHPKVKLFGICFGHQIISSALGGTCIYNNGCFEVGPTKIRLTDVGKCIFGVEKDLTLEQFHEDHVPFVPQGFHLLASTDVSMNQGMVSFIGTDYHLTPTPNSSSHPTTFPSLSEIHILTIQGHPEFTRPIFCKLIDHFRETQEKLISDALKADIERRTKEMGEGDGGLVGRAFWRILGIT